MTPRRVAGFVPGIPETKGSMAFKGMTRGGPGRKPRAIITSDNPDLRQWEETIARHITRGRGVAPVAFGDEALVVKMVFVLPRPKTAKRGAFAKTQKDVDKLARAVFDALQKCGVTQNDARICRLLCDKRLADPDGPAHFRQPGVWIMVESLEERAGNGISADGAQVRHARGRKGDDQPSLSLSNS